MHFGVELCPLLLGIENKVRQGLVLSKLVGLKGPYVHYGSMPPSDTFGYEVAIQMVLASR
jgi:hypothetical protein